MNNASNIKEPQTGRILFKNYSEYNKALLNKAANESESTLDLLVSVANVIDTDGDMIMPGAFEKTIRERGPEAEIPRIKHLWMHRVHEPIGTPLELEEVTKDGVQGLRALTKFDRATTSQDKYLQHLDGTITEFSIGYEIMKWEKDETEIDGATLTYYKLLELKLWEYSSVTWGANRYTQILKDIEGGREKALDELNDRFGTLLKIMKGSRYNDNDKELFELELKMIREATVSLLGEPSGDTPPRKEEEEPKDRLKSEALSQVDYIINQLKIK